MGKRTDERKKITGYTIGLLPRLIAIMYEDSYGEFVS